MALEIISIAELGANLLYRFYSAPGDGKLWTTDAVLTGDAFARLAGVPVSDAGTVESIHGFLCHKLAHDAEFGKKIEEEFLTLTFAPLFKELAERIQLRADVQPPDGSFKKAIRWVKKLYRMPVPDDACIRAAIALVQNRIGTTKDLGTIEVALFLHQREAAAVALAFGEALPFPMTMLLELDAIGRSRKARKVQPEDASDSDRALLMGMALSGGGIRSATLNLGILEALAELNLLRYIDYLSTVSGGGYMGSWLHAWTHEKNSEEVRDALSPKDSPNPELTIAHPVKWLRTYSNYLAPRLGFLSADTWSIFTIWARNTLLNMTVIVLALAAAMMVPRGMSVVFMFVHERNRLWLISLLPLAAALFVIQQNLRSFGEPETRKNVRRFRQFYIHLGVALPILLSGMLVAAWLSEISRFGARLDYTVEMVSVGFFVLLCYVSFLGGYHKCFFEGKPPRNSLEWAKYSVATLWFNAIAAAIGGVLILAIRGLFGYWGGAGEKWHHLVWGTVVVALAYSVVIIVHLGLFGRNLPDDRREWWSRTGAILGIWLIAWATLAGTAIYGPLLLLDLATYKLPAAGTMLAWVGTTMAGVLKARGDSTGPKTANTGSDLLSKIAPPVFVAGLLLLVSLGVYMVTVQLMGFGVLNAEALRGKYFELLNWWDPAEAAIAFIVFLSVAYYLGGRVDLNEFSMHNFYENRLVRCYMGAGRPHRKPNRFTGFDPEDDFSIARLAPPGADGTPGYGGPYPIVNTALNLVSGEELAWQERKAESFVFTPLFSGFATTPTEERTSGPKTMVDVGLYGYRPTCAYAFPGGIRLGRAMAISGAAVSPNMGYHTSSAVAFLLTVFNVRLGWWIGNPRHRTCWHYSGPRNGLAYLLVELAGSADNKSKYVYLSDGGHFENLGIYELVHRRCRYIIACDGGQDESFSFEDLGNAIRKVRADFGVEIDIDLDAVRPRSTEGGKIRSAAHCAVGSIVYPDASRGTLVYLKASLTGDEPADILEYAALNPEFPHQSTLNQFFEESQFESYRKLGYHIGKETFGDVFERIKATEDDEEWALDRDRAGFFSELRWRWLASSPKTAGSFTRHAEALAKLMQRWREDSDLAFLDTQMTPEWERLMGGAKDPPRIDHGLPATAQERRAGFYFCNALVQMMEDVYLDLNLGEESDHPDNAGWMNLFRHWAWSSMFRATWVISSSCYGARFRSFCEYKMGLSLKTTGRISIVKMSGAEDSSLNYREIELLKAGEFAPEHEFYRFDILVKRPDPPNADMTRLTVGIAAVWKADGKSGPKLAYFRVQEHLRMMGLARRIIDAMVVEKQCPVEQTPEWHPMPKTFSEAITEENRERVERMLDSAHARNGIV